jgi:hypothetical protein
MSLGDWIRLAPKPRPLGSGEKWNVFLSYRSADRAWVLNLYDVLRDLGHTVFIDQCVLRGGDELIAGLQEALSVSQAGVLVWSGAAETSAWVLKEYQVMERRATNDPNFRFVPVKLDNTPLPAIVDNRIFVDFRSYPDGPNGGELLRLLHSIVGLALTEEASQFANAQDEASRNAAAEIDAAIENGYPETLQQLFATGELPWQTSAALGCKAADGLIALGHPNEAIETLEALEVRFPRAIRPKQLRALALARRGGEGDLQKAQEILGKLYKLGERDPETLGIYGRTWMDRYAASGDPLHLRRSRDLYAEAFEGAKDDYYTGINAAAKSVFMGMDEDLLRAAEYAARVQEIVGTEPHPSDYWMTATVGEVYLMQKNYADASRLYQAAVATAITAVDHHKSTWLQACRLMERLQPTAEERALVRKAFEHLPDRGGG